MPASAPELGPAEFHPRPVPAPGQRPFEGCPRLAEQQVARLADPAAEHEAAGVEDRRQIGQSLP